MSRRILAAAMLAGAFALAQCGGKSEEAPKEKQAKESVKVSKDKMTIKDGESETEISQAGEAKIPDGFPKDILLYKGAAVLITMKHEDGFMVTLSTGDETKKVAEAYKKALTGEGWTEKASMDMGGNQMLQYAKGERECTVVIGSDKEKTQIQVQATGKTE